MYSEFPAGRGLCRRQSASGSSGDSFLPPRMLGQTATTIMAMPMTMSNAQSQVTGRTIPVPALPEAGPERMMSFDEVLAGLEERLEVAEDPGPAAAGAAV